jgi:hypothetical protein
LDISTYFSRNREKKIYPEIVLLYAPIIPFPLMLSANPLSQLSTIPPIFVSMIPGNAVHALSALDAPKLDLHFVLLSFCQISDLSPEKHFYIKKLITHYASNRFAIKNAVDEFSVSTFTSVEKLDRALLKPLELTDVLILNNIDKSHTLRGDMEILQGNNIFFTHNNNHYRIPFRERRWNTIYLDEQYYNDRFEQGELITIDYRKEWINYIVSRPYFAEEFKEKVVQMVKDKSSPLIASKTPSVTQEPSPSTAIDSPPVSLDTPQAPTNIPLITKALDKLTAKLRILINSIPKHIKQPTTSMQQPRKKRRR